MRGEVGPLPTIEEAAARLRGRQVSSVELVTAAIARADALDGRLGSYLTRFDDAALTAAKQADADFAAGIDRGPLQGIPVAVKDNILSQEGPTTGQSVVRNPAWDRPGDASCVARLRQAGAVLTGKLALSEFAIGTPDLDAPFPRPRNPWDLGCWPGGSSSGTAVAVAAGLVCAGLGSDTAGSIRIPSAFCGLTGLKPTVGRVPVAGSIPLAISLDAIGPMARSAWDCAALLQVIAGQDAADPLSLATPVPDYVADLGRNLDGLRVGVLDQDLVGPGDDTARCYAGALDVLRELGGQLIPAALPEFDRTIAAAMVIIGAEAFAFHQADLQRHWQDYSRSTRQRIGAGAFATGAQVLRAQGQRALAQRELDTLFDDVDLLVHPTTAMTAPRFGPNEELDHGAIHAAMRSARYWNCTGAPSLVLPMGLAADGLPLSLQVAARHGNESLLLAVGSAFQARTDWHRQVAPLTDSVPVDPAGGAGAPARPAEADVRAAREILRRAGVDPGPDAEAMGGAYAAAQVELAVIDGSAGLG